jgi:hypothetical protein
MLIYIPKEILFNKSFSFGEVSEGLGSDKNILLLFSSM